MAADDIDRLAAPSATSMAMAALNSSAGTNGEGHLLRCVREYAMFYSEDRTHMSLDGDTPIDRPVEPPADGNVVSMPRIGGLHHRYARTAA